ncbi:MAG: GNAT family N-acetyltransferase [Acidobacteriota bacterium]
MSSADIRPACPEDKAAILAFCQNTFNWGDYIADAWDRWMEDANGKIFVGLINTQPVAMVHVALLEKGVVWMEGMRVHPDFRRHRVGTAIDAAGRAFARERGHPIARLATSIHNIPAQKALEVQGYTRIAQFDEWVALPSDAGASPVAVASSDDVPALLALWNSSDISAATRSLLPDQWRWTELTAERLARHVDARQVRIVTGGFGLFSTHDDENEPEFLVQALAGDEQALGALAAAARAEAGYRGFARIEALVAHHPRLSRVLEGSGYTCESGMLIYEQTS